MVRDTLLTLRCCHVGFSADILAIHGYILAAKGPFFGYIYGLWQKNVDRTDHCVLEATRGVGAIFLILSLFAVGLF